MNFKIAFIIISIFNFKVTSLRSKSRNSSDILSRKARTTPYTTNNSGVGFSVAMAVPLDNGRGNIFLSWCIGAGYGQPQFDSVPPSPSLFKPQIYEDTLDKSRNLQTRKGFLTRRKFYSIAADKLKQTGFNTTQCILKAICEVAQYQFGHHNGVLGDIIHILFTPTASKDEKLPTRYYEAETNGHLKLCDEIYSSSCPISVFDLITIIK